MSRFVKTLIWLNLGILAALAINYAHLMISPGPVSKGHSEIQTDCFACHTPFVGATARKCITCHKVADIGLKTTKGKVIVKKDVKKKAVAFHQMLSQQNCTGCHTDHKGIAIYRNKYKFSHDLLEHKALEKCSSCHAKPKDKVHEMASEKCLTCHVQEKWKPATFKHENLTKAVLEKCTSCHKRPTDKLHKQVSPKCGLCHLTEKWKPATFKHELLPKVELEKCSNCHKLPTDRIHENASQKCGQCHKTEKWKPATFKHELLPRSELRQCMTCHMRSKPDDNLHRNSSDRCGNCHFTNKWKPAKGGAGSTSRPLSRSSGSFNTSPNNEQLPQWYLDERKKRLDRRRNN